ncbi:MAG: hypothetical protein ACKVOY_00040 [Burkholderiaceae bacterium]
MSRILIHQAQCIATCNDQHDELKDALGMLGAPEWQRPGDLQNGYDAARTHT